MAEEHREFWGKIPLVVFQFSFSNPDIVPASIKRRLPKETVAGREERKRVASERPDPVMIEPIERIGLADFVGYLEVAGYELVDAVYQPRIRDGAVKGFTTYNMVRFLFARHENAEPSSEFEVDREEVRAGLQKMVTDAAWRVRAYVKPFFKNGEPVPDRGVVSIHPEARYALVQPNGKPVVAWQKDAEGNRIGDAPVPLKPDYILRLEDGVIRFVEPA